MCADNSCITSTFHLQDAGHVEIISGQYGLSGAEVWCPSEGSGTCRFVGSESNSFNGFQMFVDEAYSFDYLHVECFVGNSCGSIPVTCDGDAGIQDNDMVYVSDEYECSDNGASFCCPFRNCTVFNDPDLSFDTVLSEQPANVTLLINGTADRVQDAINCTDSVCVISCAGLLGCAFSTISVTSNHTVIQCQSSFSCLGANVIIDNELSAHNVKIQCLGM